MADQYLQVVIFALIAIFIPLSMLLFSRLVRPKSSNNDVQTLSYESAEESVGQKVEIMKEYMHYFTMFLAFEIISVVVILWSTFSKASQSASGFYVAGLLVFGFVFEVFVLLIVKNKGE